MTFGFTKYFPTIHVVSEEHTAKPDLDAVAAPSNRNREVRFVYILTIQYILIRSTEFSLLTNSSTPTESQSGSIPSTPLKNTLKIFVSTSPLWSALFTTKSQSLVSSINHSKSLLL